MQVESIGTTTHAPGFEKLHKKDQVIEETQVAPAEPEQPDTEPVEQAENPETGEKLPGVLRLLQEGHFKGVADVRLRINFHDELAAIEGAQFRAVADENTSGLTDSVSPQITGLVDSGQLTAEQAGEMTDTFQQSVNQAVENFLTGQLGSKEALAGELNNAFAALVASLTALTTPPVTATDQPEENIPPADELPQQVAGEETQAIIEPPPDVTTPPVEETIEEDISQQPLSEEPAVEEQVEAPTFVSELTAAFNAALQQFLDSLNEVNVLPDLSPPKGNGVAYQKFLEIYNELYGLTNQPAADTQALDAVT